MKMRWINLWSICLLLLVHSVSLAQESSEPAKEVPGPAKTEAGNITVDFKNADIHDVLKIISYKSEVNIVAGADVSGTVTIRLVNVPWEQALDVILKTYGFVYEREGDVIRVTTLENLGKGWVIAATSMDGKIVEAIEHDRYPHVFGVQFHPEKPGLFDPTIEHSRSCNSTINFQEAIKNTDSYAFHHAYWKHVGNVLQKSRKSQSQK